MLQKAYRPLIAQLVSSPLFTPKLGVVSRFCTTFLASVGMPETTVDENYAPETREDQIGPTR
jgi:hypothetical protein